jgi:hypothetical protein
MKDEGQKIKAKSSEFKLRKSKKRTYYEHRPTIFEATFGILNMPLERSTKTRWD